MPMADVLTLLESLQLRACEHLTARMLHAVWHEQHHHRSGIERAQRRTVRGTDSACGCFELGKGVRELPNFGRSNELSVWFLLALCVRKMELISARWSVFDQE